VILEEKDNTNLQMCQSDITLGV